MPGGLGIGPWLVAVENCLELARFAGSLGTGVAREDGRLVCVVDTIPGYGFVDGGYTEKAVASIFGRGWTSIDNGPLFRSMVFSELISLCAEWA
jgi:hypothetical protein